MDASHARRITVSEGKLNIWLGEITKEKKGVEKQVGVQAQV